MEHTKLSDDAEIHHQIDDPSASAGYENLAVQDENGEYTLSFHVDGIYCAACIQKIEGTISKMPHTTHVRLNFSTGRLAISWKDEITAANDYTRAIEDLGYTVHPYDPDQAALKHNSEERFLLLCLGVAGFSLGNVMLLSVGLWSTDGETMGMATREFMHWISAVIALPTIIFSGRPFFRSAFKALKGGHTNMDVPISIALILANAMSLFETVHHGEHVYFDSALMLTFFLLIGRYLDFRARKNARSAATDLLSSLSGFATIIDGGSAKRVLVKDLKEDMIVRVSAGEKFPTDGILTRGESTVDTSLITGETVPRSIAGHDAIYAGTLNMAAPLEYRVSRQAQDSLLADIVRLMEKAEQGQAAYVRLADRAAKLYTPVVHATALLAFLGWVLIGGMIWQDALMIAITVLIITCPCALGLAVPVVQVLATGRLMKNGILVKSGDALERLAKIDTAVFDKTGTLTIGKPQLLQGYNTDALPLAASLAAHSSHILSKALAQHYDGALLPLDEIKEYAGQGIEAKYNGRIVRLGRGEWCGASNREASQHMELWLNDGDASPQVFTFSDQLRSDSPKIIHALQQDGCETILLSGDLEAPVQEAAISCNITSWHAQKTPPQKFAMLDDLKSKGRHVLMVGDGLNDAPALASADISIAPGTAIDVAQNAADIVFMGEDLAPVYTAYRTAKRTQSLITQNFALAILYNIIAIPLALAGMVTPLIAALAMSGSSLLVIANAFRLRFQS